MRKSPITIALAIAGIIAGTHASIAAISNESTEKVSEAVTAQTQPQAAAQEQAQVGAGRDDGSRVATAGIGAGANRRAGSRQNQQADG